MKKICFFSGDITRSGGTERVSIMIANEWKKQGNYEILFLSLTEQSEKPFFPMEQGIPHYALGNRWIQPGPGYLAVIPKLYRFLKKHKIDVLIDIDIVLDVLAIPASKGLNIKIISWEHFNCDYEMSVLYRRMILKYSVKHTDYVVVLTERDRRRYGELVGRTANIAAIYNPIEHTICKAPEKKENWIITTGQLVHRKGIDYLAKTAVSVLKQHKDWKWLFLGEGEERPYLEKIIKENGICDQLILTGRVADVNAYLQRAQIFVLTSRIEGLPMCLLEAKAHHLPCVSFDIRTGFDEMIEDGINGYLIQPFDCDEMGRKIGELIENDELRDKFARNAQQGMQKFQMEYIMKNWDEVLRRLCG